MKRLTIIGAVILVLAIPAARASAEGVIERVAYWTGRVVGWIIWR